MSEARNADDHGEADEIQAEPRRYRSLADVAVKLSEDPELDRALEEQRQIDWDMWR
jgi:hypothetical protein